MSANRAGTYPGPLRCQLPQRVLTESARDNLSVVSAGCAFQAVKVTEKDGKRYLVLDTTKEALENCGHACLMVFKISPHLASELALTAQANFSLIYIVHSTGIGARDRLFIGIRNEALFSWFPGKLPGDLSWSAGLLLHATPWENQYG
jgi:hypothetical protein